MNACLRSPTPHESVIPVWTWLVLTNCGLTAGEREAEHDAMVKLMDKILAAKRADAAANVTALEREINERVYRFYGLTPEEIRIGEESDK